MRQLGEWLEQKKPTLEQAINTRLADIDNLLKRGGPGVEDGILQAAYAVQPELLALKGIPYGEKAAQGSAAQFASQLSAKTDEVIRSLKAGDIAALQSEIGL
jgi:hypothetical protein